MESVCIEISRNILPEKFFHQQLLLIAFIPQKKKKVSWLVSNGQEMDTRPDSCHKSHQFCVHSTICSTDLLYF